jgi:hypothetical protein
MGVVSDDDGEWEAAMVLPIGDDTGPHPRL